jgi:hypothetical protein
MSGFTLNDDTFVEICAALAMLMFLALAVRSIIAKRVFAGIAWLVPAALAGAVLIFFLTFQIRLM